MKYPFTPKSTAYLEPGQFWSIPLSNGQYGCGVVLANLYYHEKIETRVFYAGLLDWTGPRKPTSELLIDCRCVKSGALHVKAIGSIDSEIEGKTNLEDLPPNPSEYSHDIVTMGYGVLSVVAEKIFVTQSQHGDSGR